MNVDAAAITVDDRSVLDSRLIPRALAGHLIAAEVAVLQPRRALALATLLCVIGVTLTLVLDPLLKGRASFLVFIPPVVAGAVFGGRVVGMIGVALGTFSGLLVEHLNHAFATGSFIAAASYAVVAVPLALGGSALSRARQSENATAAELARRGALLNAILRTVPDAMVVIDDAGIIRDFSPNAEQQFGWAVVDAIGKDVTMLMPESYRPAHPGHLRRYLRSRERRVIGRGREVVGLRKDHTTFPMELAVGELDLPEGSFFVGFVRDISDRQESETRLKEVQNELVHVSRLTALGEMATALAHELNQPLSAIGNYLLGSKTLLRRVEVPHARVAEAVDLAAREALRAGEIIRRIREFVSRGQTEHWPESLPRLLQDTVALALVEAKDRGVDVRFRLDPTVEWVMVNKVQIQQVVFNLIRNAADAMRNAETRVIELTTEPGIAGFARVTISDTGAGIDPQIAGDLFRPFVTTKQTGLGVGLSICRTIIEAHGGEVGGVNGSGGGALFHLTLPLGQAADPYERA